MLAVLTRSNVSRIAIISKKPAFVGIKTKSDILNSSDRVEVRYGGVSEEAFFEPLKHVIEDFKIKGSYGVVGNTNIDDYASRSYYLPHHSYP
jgi:hypothetical protein